MNYQSLPYSNFGTQHYTGDSLGADAGYLARPATQGGQQGSSSSPYGGHIPHVTPSDLFGGGPGMPGGAFSSHEHGIPPYESQQSGFHSGGSSGGSAQQGMQGGSSGGSSHQSTQGGGSSSATGASEQRFRQIERSLQQMNSRIAMIEQRLGMRY